MVILLTVELIETGLAQMGKDFKMIVSSGEKIICITKKQFTFLKNFLATGDVDAAAEIAGVQRNTVLCWFRDSKFKQFLQERLKWAADRNGCTFDWAISELMDHWKGKTKKNKTQVDSMKEINRMLGHVKEFQGGINAREFINAEYVIIQKDNTLNIGPQSPQISNPSGSIPGQIYLPDVREAVGEVHPGGMEGHQGDQPAALDGVVCQQPTEAGQGHDLGQDAADANALPAALQGV